MDVKTRYGLRPDAPESLLATAQLQLLRPNLDFGLLTWIDSVTVRSGILARYQSAAAGSSTTIATVQATDTWIIKTINLYNGNAASASVTIDLVAAAGGTIAQIYNKGIGTGVGDQITGWWALGPGDTIFLGWSLGPIHVWISGADLLGHL